MKSAFLSLSALAFLAVSTNAQEMVENPEFTSWSKFKKGTSTSLKIASSSAGVSSEIVAVSMLVEVSADKVVLESSSVIKANGMEFKTPPMKRDVTKTIPLPKGFKKEDFTSGKVPGTITEGTETLKINGVEVKTKWRTYKSEVGNAVTEAKQWTSDELPGLIVKLESTTKVDGVTTTNNMEIVDFKKP